MVSSNHFTRSRVTIFLSQIADASLGSTAVNNLLQSFVPVVQVPSLAREVEEINLWLNIVVLRARAL